MKFLGAILYLFVISDAALPIVINTWPWTNATQAAWDTMTTSGSALDAAEAGCRRCQIDQCDGTVGYGGSPDETGQTTLDAMIMDGTTMEVGAVGDLQGIRDAIGVARFIMEHTKHTILAGNQVTDFAIQMGFEKQSLETDHSLGIWSSWKENNCQPNYWLDNVAPDPTKQCGPYAPDSLLKTEIPRPEMSQYNHDTIGMVAIDKQGNVVSATSTNGANHKIAGRVGDSPIMGAGSYADSEVGGCGATGDGDVMMRFLPCYQAIESMRNGKTPQEAAEDAIQRIGKKFPNYQGAIIVVDTQGQHAGAAWGWTFTYSVCSPDTENKPQVVTVPPIGPPSLENI